jgi:ferredoxin-type protein NapH
LDRLFRGPSQNRNEEETTLGRQVLIDRLGGIKGNHWSAQIGGVSLTDPLGAAESAAAGHSLAWTILIGAAIPVLLTVVLGRVFCSWICPAGLMFELTDKLRRLVPKRYFPGANLSFWRGHKYVLLGTGLLLSFFLGAPLLGLFYPPALLGRETALAVQTWFGGLTKDPIQSGWFALSGISLFLFGIILLEWVVSKRMWCRYLCPGGALYSLLGRKRLLRLKNETSLCTECGECVRVCPMGLNPMRQEFGMECDHCFECLTHCSPGSVQLATGWAERSKNLGRGDESRSVTPTKQG